MDWISRGRSNADIAGLLQVQPKTVKNHINRIFTKLGAANRVEAVLIWQRTA
ncbi:response regulator transcription factor [Paractinoplanes durhamensis]